MIELRDAVPPRCVVREGGLRRQMKIVAMAPCGGKRRPWTPIVPGWCHCLSAYEALVFGLGKGVSGLLGNQRITGSPWKRRREGGETPNPTSIISRGVCAGTVPM